MTSEQEARKEDVDRPLRVCYFGTYRTKYSRNRIMIEGLRRSGVKVLECNEPLWRGIEDRVRAASGEWWKPRFLLRAIRSYSRLLFRCLRAGEYDVLIVGYPGQIDVFPARILSWLRRKPLVWDIFMSIYLISLERGLDERSRTTIRLIRRLEQIAGHLPDLLILDTKDYVRWFSHTHNVPPERFRLVPTGADSRVFSDGKDVSQEDAIFDVIYYGTFIPNHGVPTIIEAARLLRDDPSIHLTLIGDGPQKSVAVDMADDYGLGNVTFMDWLEQRQLVNHLATADACLGVFGSTPQSLMTVQNKIYEAMAMRKAIITGDSRPIRAYMTHATHLYLCPRDDPQGLADAIRVLRADPLLCEQLADNAHQLFLERFDVGRIGELFARHLQEVLE